MSASSPQPAALEAALRQAGDLGRRHGRAAVYWQIGDSSSGREFYRELLRGIASADPAITGLYAVPDLTARGTTSAATWPPTWAWPTATRPWTRPPGRSWAPPARSSGWRPPGWPAAAWHPALRTRPGGTRTAPSRKTPGTARPPRTGGRTSPTPPPA